MNGFNRAAFLGAVLLISPNASAQTTQSAINSVPQLSWYIGAGVGGGHLNRSAGDLTGLNNASLDSNDTTWTVRGGWRFSPFAAVELGYYDFGRYNFSGTAVGNVVPIEGSGKAQSVMISLVGILPISTFDIYGRIGYAHSELKLNANGVLATANENERQNEAAYGAGVRWTFARNWALFAEWAKNDKIKIDSYVGGVDVRF